MYSRSSSHSLEKFLRTRFIVIAWNVSWIEIQERLWEALSNPASPEPVCGNGIKERGEVCDCGRSNKVDGESNGERRESGMMQECSALGDRCCAPGDRGENGCQMLVRFSRMDSILFFLHVCRPLHLGEREITITLDFFSFSQAKPALLMKERAA